MFRTRTFDSSSGAPAALNIQRTRPRIAGDQRQLLAGRELLQRRILARRHLAQVGDGVEVVAAIGQRAQHVLLDRPRHGLGEGAVAIEDAGRHGGMSILGRREPVRRVGLSGPEVFGVDRADDQALRVGRPRASASSTAAARRAGSPSARRLTISSPRDSSPSSVCDSSATLLVAHLVQHGEVAVAAGRRQRHLQVRDLDAVGVRAALRDPRGDVADERVAVEVGAGEPDACS